jgi:hypothetical protein
LPAYLEITVADFRTKYGFITPNKELGADLTAAFAKRGSKEPQPGEVESWNESLPKLAEALHDADLDNLSMFIEFDLPPSNRCADVVLAGPGKTRNQPVYMVVELKQWTDFEVRQSDGKVLAGSGRGKAKWKTHPWKQVRNYREYLADAYGLLGKGYLYAAAYLHNATDDFMARLRSARGGAGADMFGASERDKFQKFLRQVFESSESPVPARSLRNARPRFSDSLLNRIHAEFDESGSDRFVLLGEQEEAYEEVVEAVHQAALQKKKAAVIVRGKPGTGKTAVAMRLAGEYFRNDLAVYYQVWHAAFREALIAHSGLRPSLAEQVFLSPRGEIVREHKAPMNIALSICDEAHRLEEWTKERKVQGTEPQIKDILATSDLHVFFIDDDQQVKMKEIGTVERLRTELEKLDVIVSEVELTTQFRSGGVEAYVDWTRKLVGLEDSPPERWRQREDFELWIAEWPGEVEQILQARISGKERYRITAGFCWPWPEESKGRGRVEIGNWRKDWNLKSGGSPDGPESKKWAWEKGGHRQVGCVHTSQGLEWEWTGVIIGPDLIWDGKRSVPVLENNLNLPNYAKDPEKRKKAEKLIRNAYYILMTRGQRGAVIYAEDSLLRAELRSLVEPLTLPLTAKEQQDLPRALNRLHPDFKATVDAFHRDGGPLARASVEYVPSYRTELAWREKRVAILPDALPDDDAKKAKQAYADAGWIAQRASDWDAADLLAALKAADTESANTTPS